MIKATFCVYDKPDSVGGPVTWIQRLLPMLRERDIEPRCLFLLHWGDTGPALESLRAQGIDCKAILAPDRTEERVRWILDRLSEDPPDVFVPNLVVAGYFAARWAREAGIPTVAVLHSDDSYYRALQDEFMLGPRRNRVSAAVCVSRELERQVIERNPPILVRRIPYGVFLPPGERDSKVRPLRVAYVGRLANEQKRISDVTRALCRVTTTLTGIEAVIFGDGPDRAVVEELLSAAPKPAAVRLAGAIASHRIQEELLSCDIIVLLSDYEGLPIALLEGMACGCVPVSIRMKSGIPELVEHEVTGLIVNDRDDGFLNAIRRLRDDPPLRRRLGNAARELIRQQFSADLSADRWAALIGELHSAPQVRKLRIPRRIVLPPRNPSIEDASARVRVPSLTVLAYRRVRIVAGRLRRVLLRSASG